MAFIKNIKTSMTHFLLLQGESYDEFHNALKALPHSDYPALSDSSTTFKVNVETFMKKTSVKERIQLIETMDYLPIAVIDNIILYYLPLFAFITIVCFFWGRGLQLKIITSHIKFYNMQHFLLVFGIYLLVVVVIVVFLY